MDTAKVHAGFLKNLDESEPAVLAIAWILSQEGWMVEIPKVRKAPTFEDRREYGDQGDLFIESPGARLDSPGIRHRIEVKRSTRWKDTERMPFSHPAVDTVKVVDAYTVEPEFHYLVNDDVTWYARIHASTRPRWVIRTLQNRPGVFEPTYMCPGAFVQWMGKVPEEARAAAGLTR